jgi:PadR family transcriptional regulator PadR
MNIDTENGGDSLSLIVKAGKEILILSMLSDKPMSGYDLIKEIFSDTGVFLSQGTIYPILYSFEDSGVLRAAYEKSDMRTKRYHITPKGRETARDEIEQFVEALSFINDLLCQSEKDSSFPQLIPHQTAPSIVISPGIKTAMDEENCLHS